MAVNRCSPSNLSDPRRLEAVITLKGAYTKGLNNRFQFLFCKTLPKKNLYLLVIMGYVCKFWSIFLCDTGSSEVQDSIMELQYAMLNYMGCALLIHS